MMFRSIVTAYDVILWLFSSKKLEMEHSLAQNLAHMNAMMQEKEKLSTNNFILQDTIGKMK